MANFVGQDLPHSSRNLAGSRLHKLAETAIATRSPHMASPPQIGSPTQKDRNRPRQRRRAMVAAAHRIAAAHGITACGIGAARGIAAARCITAAHGIAAAHGWQPPLPMASPPPRASSSPMVSSPHMLSPPDRGRNRPWHRRCGVGLRNQRDQGCSWDRRRSRSRRRVGVEMICLFCFRPPSQRFAWCASFKSGIVLAALVIRVCMLQALFKLS